MILKSLSIAVGNMFDSKYFAKASFRYFPKDQKAEFESAKEEFAQHSPKPDFAHLSQFLNKYFFKFTYDFDESAENQLMDKKGSATKFFILIQEILIHSVKYASLIPFEKRFLHISAKKHANGNIVISVSNSMSAPAREKTTGMGGVIITNIAKMLDSTPEITKSKEEEYYEVRIEFQDFWQVKSPVSYSHETKETFKKVSEPPAEYRK